MERKVTPQDLIGLRLPVDVAVSPDGRRVAFAVAEVDFTHGEHDVQLYVAPDEPPAVRAKGNEAEGEDEAKYPDRQLTRGLSQVADPQWSPDGRYVGFVTFRPQPHEDEDDDQREDGGDKNQVFLLPAGGGEAYRLTEAAEGVEFFRWAADGSGVYFAGHAPRPAAERGWRRRRKDNKEDAVRVHGELPYWEIWFQPLDGHAHRLLGGLRGLDDFDVSPDGKLLVYGTNHTGRTDDNDHTELILHRVEDGKERRLTAGRGGAELIPTFTPDGRWLYFQAWADPRFAFSRQELFAAELGDDPVALVESEAAIPLHPLLASLDRDLEEYVVLADGRAAALVAWGMGSRLALTDPRGAEVVAVPLGEAYVTHLAAAFAEPRLAAVFEDAAHPPEVGFIDAATGAITRLTDLNPEVEDWRRATRRRVTWDNEGFTHEGLLLLPHASDRLPGGKPPLLVWLHGGPHWRVTDSLRSYDAEAFAAEGWAVFLPQYRGSSGYGEPYQLAIRGDLGGAEARDVLAGVDEVGRLGLADLERMAVGGASYGGYLTNWLLATTKRFKAGVSMAGIFDLGQDFSTSEFGSWEVHYLGGTPWEKPALYRERSPLTYAAQITAPLLILHGLEDDNTFVTNGKGLYRALSTLGRTVEFVVYPREGHGLSEPAHRLDEAQRTLEWLGRHVLGGATPRLVGGTVKNGVVWMRLLGQSTRREYNGVRPGEGRTFLEISVLLRAIEGGPEVLRLIPSGAQSDIVLTDDSGDLYRPVGIPVDVHGQTLLLFGGGVLESWKGEDTRPPSLPATAVFELPDQPRNYRLRVQDLPPIMIQVGASDDEGD